MSRFSYIARVLWPRSNVKKVIILLFVAIVASSGGFFVVSEQTWFCNSCHIMNPYYASWQASEHSEVNCLECHIQPGFEGLVHAKLNGLAQAVDFFLGRFDPKPNALVTDASCLRDGCHTKASLSAEPVAEINGKYKFSHKGHIDANISGLPLLCTTCHSHFEGPEHFKVNTQVCFVCHFSKAAAGTARPVDTKCRDCHNVPAEPLKQGQVEIDHNKFIAAQLSCEQFCHSKQIDPNNKVSDIRCLDCHEFRNQAQDTPEDLHASHSGKEKVECLACHEMLNHSKSPIEKHHTSLKCDQCHQVPFEGARLAEIEFIKLPGDCSLCHNGPHSGQFQKTCQQCHSEHGWTGRWVAYPHGPESKFPLKGKHITVECSRCHMGAKLARARFVGLPRTCEQCHPDPHGGQFTQGCPTCHSEQGWKSLRIDPHSLDPSFPLSGKHQSLECVKCHIPPQRDGKLAEARFVRLAENGCASCHRDQHNGQMRFSCDTCHTQQGWTGSFLLFTHDRNSEFKLDSIHSDLACSSCHKDGQARLYSSLPRTCEQCHTDIVRYQFSEQSGAVNPHAGRVSCVKCHSTDLKHQEPAVYAAACRNCHNSHYEGLFYDWMKSFDSRQSRARQVLERLRKQNPQKAEALEQKINDAGSVGFHNLNLAIKLWDEIAQEQ